MAKCSIKPTMNRINFSSAASTGVREKEKKETKELWKRSTSPQMWCWKQLQVSPSSHDAPHLRKKNLSLWLDWGKHSEHVGFLYIEFRVKWGRWMVEETTNKNSPGESRKMKTRWPKECTVIFTSEKWTEESFFHISNFECFKSREPSVANII